jgi:hypothetical protein
MRPAAAMHPGVRPIARRRAWRVLHACAHPGEVAALLDGQELAGMKPSLVCEHNFRAESGAVQLGQKRLEAVSLINAWRAVNAWRSRLAGCDPTGRQHLVHAHCFAAGMAAVRGEVATVYDMDAPVEDLARAAGLLSSDSWTARSFSAAERFVLSRAGAVAVHSTASRELVLQRGCDPKRLFLVPDPVDVDAKSACDRQWLLNRFGLSPASVAFFAADACVGSKAQSKSLEICLQAFAGLGQSDRACLLVPVQSGGESSLLLRAVRAGVHDRVFMVPDEDRLRVLASADVVIASVPQAARSLDRLQPNQSALQALLHGRALLAADCTPNRDVSPEGRGCLWFSAEDAADLRRRITFLSQQQEFRFELAASGYHHLLETRSPAAVAKQYGPVYEAAYARRKDSGGLDRTSGLLPLEATA